MRVGASRGAAQGAQRGRARGGGGGGFSVSILDNREKMCEKPKPIRVSGLAPTIVPGRCKISRYLLVVLGRSDTTHQLPRKQRTVQIQIVSSPSQSCSKSSAHSACVGGTSPEAAETVSSTAVGCVRA